MCSRPPCPSIDVARRGAYALSTQKPVDPRCKAMRWVAYCHPSKEAAMSANYSSIKLSSQFVGEAKREAEVLHRSVGAQVEYWAKLGRAIENTPGFNVGLIRDTLGGKLRLDGLTAAEQPEALNAISAAFDAPDEEVRSFYAALGKQEGAVGTDGKGGVIRRQASVRNRER
jgi:hypothetical protein